MHKTLVYDLPTRLFHWLFALGFLGAFFIAKNIDDDSPYYSYHMLLGLILASLVVLRVVWGLIGSRYARFSSFELKPSLLALYFKQLITGQTDRKLGHNPASSWSSLLMLTLALGLAVTGYLMTSGGNKEDLEDIHEFFANTFILTVIAHIAGVTIHTLRHKDALARSMWDGKKESIPGQEGLRHPYPAIAALFLILIGGYVFYLAQNYDRTTQTLQFFGTSLQLGGAKDSF